MVTGGWVIIVLLGWILFLRLRCELPWHMQQSMCPTKLSALKTLPNMMCDGRGEPYPLIKMETLVKDASFK
ncbi:hypothetical protein BABINDRAFT_160941 [Babjeviella inositovora NRRL Y-12698]|uniref:Uncharacterized protein n=1 Tax=Babjeviella inositovora NRRL Y-12698 TaxID=984486 RepID=A0A1E3QT80_9ASCO|nr:uncharacterized protein BABINDRAFT_160941 [Babjeviella inositovora NRRL Y-12698]ODQ80714.1 hypothetical protein BABINDRAFT_160941 [Babjeviella inositovora NRRL Y-12698]